MTVHGNDAVAGRGGGIDAYAGTFTITSSTITGNSATGGGGGVYAKVAGEITNSISAGNIADVLFDLIALEATYAAANILGEAPALIEGAVVTVIEIDPGEALVLANAGLSLSDVFAQIDAATGGGLAAANGGFGATVGLTLNSANPALGAADEETVSGADARGVLRVATGADIGAFEAPGTETPSLAVTTALDVVNDNDGLTSLREALGHANSGALAGTITFASGAGEAFEGGGTATLSTGALAITGQVAIDGGKNGAVVDAGGLSRAFVVEDGGSASLSGDLTVSGGLSAGAGGGALVRTGGAMMLDGTIFSGNQSLTDGGGGAVESGGTLTAVDARFNNNSASRHGGGISNDGETHGARLAIVDNSAGSGGGGGVNATGLTILSDGENGRNSASEGGGISMRGAGADLQITNVTVHGNEANSGSGGGIEVSGGVFTIASSTITGNSATGIGGGGGLFAHVAGQITNSISAGNTAVYGADVQFGAAAFEATYAAANILGEAPALIDGTVVEIAPEDALVLANAGLSLSDVFAQIDGATGGGLAAANGGFGATVALTPTAANPAISTADEATVSNADARGIARDPAQADIGAFEAPGTDAPSLVVTTALDVVKDSDGLTSLREAIGYANSGAATGTITFASGAGEAFEGGGTAALSMGELVITGNVVIDGDIGGDGTADVTVDAVGTSRVMGVASGSLDLTGLIITGGEVGPGGFGAGIVVTAGGALALDIVRIEGNTAGLVGAYGSAGGLGGGVAILAGSTLTARDVAITGNVASLGGGGLYVDGGSASFINAEFSGNQAGDGVAGGKIGVGGGIWAKSGSLELVNATVHGNAAVDEGGGIFSSLAAVTIDHSTITANEGTSVFSRGVVAYQGALTVTNSIIAGNVPDADRPGLDLLFGAPGSGMSVSLSAVLLGEAAYQIGLGIAPAAGTMVLDDLSLGLGAVFAALDGGAPALADNGGFVRTVALSDYATNPALNVAFPVFDADVEADGDGIVDPTLSVDARGEARGFLSDLGAYETPLSIAPSLVVTTLMDVVDSADGLISLREAIAFVEGGALTGTITFATGGGVLSLDGTEIVISGDVSIDGSTLGEAIYISADYQSRILRVTDGATLTLSDIRLTTGSADGDGGAVLVESGGALALNKVDASANEATGDGGGIFVASGATLTGRDVQIASGLSVNGDGGAIAVQGEAMLVNAGFIGNGATYDGAVHVSNGGALHMLNATVAANLAYSGGGGVSADDGGSADIAFTTITDNKVNGFGYTGGGLAVSDTAGEVTVANSIIVGNASGGSSSSATMSPLQARRPFSPAPF